jgi:hypothetical protein
MNGNVEQRCMICQRPNPDVDSATLPVEWGVSTDKEGEVSGVICPSCITGELLSITAGGRLPVANR